MDDLGGIRILFPYLVEVHLDQMTCTGAGVCLWVSPRAATARCPTCGNHSQRVHSRYERHLADQPIAGQAATVRLRARRFFCLAEGCPAKTFAEQVDGLTTRHARRTPLLLKALARIGLALAGRAGARLAQGLGINVGRSSVLRLLRSLPDPPTGTLHVIGVDDFAFRRGHVYGTVLIDMATHRPVDVLPDREADTFADWLRSHQQITVICRDRASAYADGARAGAPQAVQVADRWHLWHNLARHVEKTVARHRPCLRPQVTDLDEKYCGPVSDRYDLAQAEAELQRLAADADTRRSEDRVLVIRTRQRYDAIQALLTQHKNHKVIMQELGLSRATVRRSALAASVEELVAKPLEGRASILDAFKPYLHERWNAGITNMLQLHREITERGYRGGYWPVRTYLVAFRDAGSSAPPVPAPPKARRISTWILRRPDTLDQDEHAQLADIRTRCTDLDRLATHVTEFAKILTTAGGDRLNAWITAVEADDQPDLHSFITGLKRDWNAVIAGLTTPHNSGAVEGNVNRIKMIKRQMYGRAKFDLLRKRILLSH